MIRLIKARNAWGTPDFEGILKAEVEQLDVRQLPLQQGLSYSSYVSAARPTLMMIRAGENEGCIRVKAGVFYAGIVAGCSCADDPTPVDEVTEYCELQFDIDKETAETVVTLLMA